MYKTLVFALLLAVIYTTTAPKSHHQAKYEAWKSQHKVSYEASEEKYRMLLFKKKDAEIKAHNKDTTQTYKKGHNQFSCLTEKEFEENYLGVIPPSDQEVNLEDDSNSDSNDDSNDDSNSESLSVQGQDDHPIIGAIDPIDWVADGMVTPVKSQGRCGSCWAFAAVGHLESLFLIEAQVKLDLSEQQLVNCVYSRDGCRGGWMSTAYRHIAYGNRGIATESQIPYTATYGSCRKGGPYKIKSYTSKARYSCEALLSGLNNGPVAVALSASGWSSYRSGIFSGCQTRVNHGVLLVAVDANGNWRIKNSWNTGWGDGGFMWLPKGNSCQICKYSTEFVSL